MNKMKEARLRAKMETKDVAAMLGYPVKTIEEWDSGVKKAPPFVEMRIIQELEKIAKKHESV